jgi:hypothetical protein
MGFLETEDLKVMLENCAGQPLPLAQFLKHLVLQAARLLFLLKYAGSGLADLLGDVLLPPSWLFDLSLKILNPSEALLRVHGSVKR